MVHSGFVKDASVQSLAGKGLTPLGFGGGGLGFGFNSGVSGRGPVGCHCGVNLSGVFVLTVHG